MEKIIEHFYTTFVQIIYSTFHQVSHLDVTQDNFGRVTHVVYKRRNYPLTMDGIKLTSQEWGGGGGTLTGPF